MCCFLFERRPWQIIIYGACNGVLNWILLKLTVKSLPFRNRDLPSSWDYYQLACSQRVSTNPVNCLRWPWIEKHLRQVASSVAQKMMHKCKRTYKDSVLRNRFYFLLHHLEYWKPPWFSVPDCHIRILDKLFNQGKFVNSQFPIKSWAPSSGWSIVSSLQSFWLSRSSSR